MNLLQKQKFIEFKYMSGKEEHLPKIDKNPMREITNSSKNKLATRLYRNSSLSRINPNISMLSSSIQQYDPSYLNCSVNASTSQLIASISLKKLKKKAEFEPYLQINNGKMLINKRKGLQAESFMKDNSPKPKKMFKKLDKLSHSPSNKILPDQLIDFPIETQQPNENKLVKKSSLSTSPKSKANNNRFSSEYEDREDLLPEDFIQLLSEDKNITNQFCYLKKMDHPYDLKIVQFDKNFEKKQNNTVAVEYPSQYITISSRGVTYFSSQQSRFVPLQQWKREANYFKKIIKLDFFKNFKVIKNFSNWKKYIRKSAMKSTIQKLKQKMVFNDKFLRSSLLQIRGICYVLQTDVSYCRLDDCNKVANFKQFKTAQQIFIQNEFERRIFQLEENIKQVLMNNMADSMKEFKQENKISSSIQGKGMPLLIGDQKNLEMPYTKQATLRTQQQKFQKFVKLVDLLITHSKVNMMSESTTVLSRKINDENETYERQVVDSNYKNTYKGKQYLQCILTLDCSENALFLRPTKQDLTSLFQDIVNRSVVRLCRNHKKISSDIDVLSIIYDSQEQFPKQSESQNLKAIMTSDNRQQEMLKLIMSSVSVSYEHILNFVKKFKDLARVNFENIQKMDDIEKLQSKDHQTIKNLIQKWQKQKQMISLISKQHEGPLFELNLKEFKEKAERTTNECISKIKQVIPRIFEQAINQLQQNLLLALSQIEQKPIGVQALMTFNQHKYRIMSDIDDYSDRMMEIMCLQTLMRNILPSNSQSNGFKKFEKEIKDLQSSLHSLRQKLNEADVNNKMYEDRAQKSVKQMIPNNKRKLKELYAKISDICQKQQQSKQIVSFIQRRKNDLSSIITQFDNIRVYQRFLNLEESDTGQTNSFVQFFGVFQKLWLTANQFENFKIQLQQNQWGSIKPTQTNSKLQQFITIMVGLQKIIKQFKEKDAPFQFSQHDFVTIQMVLEEIQEMKPLIETIECLNDKTLGQKQWKQIKQTLEPRNPKLTKIFEADRYQTKTKQLINAEAASQLHFFKGVAMKAKKNNEIYTKFDSVRTFTNFSKSNPNIFRNLTQKFKSTIGQFMGQLDQKIIMTNFILEQTQQSDKQKQQRTKIQKNTLQKLKQILVLWNDYEEHVQYFEPIYTSMGDWKITHEGKLFISATEQNWKKTYRSFNKQTNLSKFISTQRIIPSLKQSNQVLQSLYPSIGAYFNSKRLQSTRLYFLSDQQIIKIHFQNKDFRGFNKYIGKIFPSVKELLIKQEQTIPHEVVNWDGEHLPIKFGRVSNFEVEEMIRAMDEGIKSGIKCSLRSCYNAFDSQQFCKINWIKENPLQALIFINRVYFTKIIQQDYLSTEGDDLDKLYNYHLSQILELRNILKQESENQAIHKKLLVLLTQSLGIRDIISHLIDSNTGTKQSYEWQKQVRHYYNSQQAYVQYLNIPILYGNQFVCMIGNPLLTTMLNQKVIVNLINNMLCCSNVPIVSKSFLPQVCAYNAKPYNNINLVSGKQTSFLENAIIGTWLTGSFTDISLSSEFTQEQLLTIARTIQQVQLAVSLKQPYFRGFKNMSLNRQSGISILCPALMDSPRLKQCRFDYRIIHNMEVAWEAYIQLLFEIYNIDIPSLAKKLARVFQYLQSTIAELQINRSDFKTWIVQITQQQQINQNFITRFILKKINKKQFKTATRKFISKMFHQVFNIACLEQLTSYKSIRDFSPTQQEVGKIVATLKQNKICIVTGQNSQFKELLVLSARKSFIYQNTKPKFIIVRENNIDDLLGKFENGKWVNGLLYQKINCPHSEKQCFILIGNCCRKLLNLLQKLDRLDRENGFINLQNGQKLSLKTEQRIIFMAQADLNDPIFNNCSIKMHDFTKTKFAPEELLSHLLKQKTNQINNLTIQNMYFSQHPDMLSTLTNLYLNNNEKINGANLKTIGFKSQYGESDLIMSRFVTLISTCLAKDTQKSCLNNPKMFQKLYLWSLFWSISCCLPKRCIQRLQKLFDSIKIQYEKTQSLNESKFSIYQRNQTIFKFIKSDKVFQNQVGDLYLILPELQAKKQLIKMLVVQNNHIMISGENGCGKTGFTNYLQSVFRGQGYSIARTNITKNTSVEIFLQWLKPKTYLQYFPNNSNMKYKLCSTNGKKLIVIVDNFNLIHINSSLFQFFHAATSFGYYFDNQTHNKILLGDICFVCCKNGAFQSVVHMSSFLVRKFYPIYVNHVQLSQIMKVYSENLQRINVDQNKAIIKKILPSIASMHSFASNMNQNSENTNQYRFVSYSIPIWIAKQLISKAENDNVSVAELVSIWRYFTIKKYIQSGIMSKFKDEIQHQLSNLISLICKNPTQPQNFMKEDKNLISQILKANPLLSLSSDYSQFYIYFACLLKSEQTKHLITDSHCTVPALRSQALKQICQKSKINYVYAKNEKQLQAARNLKNMVIYIDKSNKRLIQLGIECLIEEHLNPQLTFMIDLQSKQQLMQYIRFYPSIEDYANIYTINSNSYSNTQSISYYNIVNEIIDLSDIELKNQQRNQLFCSIDQMIKQNRHKLNDIVQKRISNLQIVYQNFKTLSQTIQDCSIQSQKLTAQINVLSQKQDQALLGKNKLVQQLSKLKKQNGQINSQSKQAINKNIVALDAEIKKIKSSKNQKIQKVAKLKDSFKQKLQINSLLTYYRQLFQRDYSICSQLMKDEYKREVLLVLNAILYLNFNNTKDKNIKKLLDGAKVYSVQKLVHELNNIYSAILGVQIQNVLEEECIIKWIASNYQSVFVTYEPDKLMEKLLAKCPQAKLCTTPLEFSQHVGTKPVIAKQFNYWNHSKVSIICSQSKNSDSDHCIRYECSQKEKDEDFRFKIYHKISQKHNQNYTAQIKLVKNEKKRFEIQQNLLRLKLKDKLKQQKIQFLSTNSLSQIKQIFDSIVAMHSRAATSKQKIETLQKQMQSKYGQVVSRACFIRQLISTQLKMFPYINIADSQFIQLVMRSLSYKIDEKTENKTQEAQVKYELSIEDSNKKLFQKCSQWVCLQLTLVDSVYAVFLNACYSLLLKKVIKSDELQTIVKFMSANLKEQRVSIRAIGYKKLDEVLQNMNQQKQNKLFSMIQFADSTLQHGLASIIKNKQNWINSLTNIFQKDILNTSQGNKHCRLYVAIGPLQINSPKLIDKEVRRFTTNQQNIVFLSESSSIQNKLQSLEKIPISQQGWIILLNWKKGQNINRMLEFTHQSKNYKTLFLFENKNTLNEAKAKLNNQDYYQVALFDRTKTNSYQIARLFSKHYSQSLSGDINRILRMMASDEVSKFCKGLTDCRYKSTSYSYRILQYLIKRNPKTTALDLVSFATDYYYSFDCPQDRLFLRQAKKITKSDKIPQIFDDGSLPPAYNNCFDNFQLLKAKLDKQDKLRSFLHQMLPEQQRKIITSDSLMFGIAKPDKAQTTQNSHQKLSKIDAFLKLQSILQKIPILGKNQQTDKSTALYLEILKSQKKAIGLHYNCTLEKLKNFKKILQSKRAISANTQKMMLQVLSKSIDQILQQFLRLEEKWQSIQKQLQLKQGFNLCINMELVSKPSHFLYAYMFQTLSNSKIDWSTFGLHIRCLTDKQKQLMKDAIDKNQYLQISNLKINNGRFEQHKLFLESIVKGESSKLNNTYIYIGKQESQPLNRRIPLIINDVRVAEIEMSSKAKQTGFWGCPVFATL